MTAAVLVPLLGLLGSLALVQLSGLGISGESGPWGCGGLLLPCLPSRYIRDGCEAILHALLDRARVPFPGCPLPRRKLGAVLSYAKQVDEIHGEAREEMLDFGHSWTGYTVSVFQTLDHATLDAAMRDLHSQEGRSMGFVQHTIGSSHLDGDQDS